MATVSAQIVDALRVPSLKKKVIVADDVSVRRSSRDLSEHVCGMYLRSVCLLLGGVQVLFPGPDAARFGCFYVLDWSSMFLGGFRACLFAFNLLYRLRTERTIYLGNAY